MAPQTPVLLVDNKFDSVSLYAAATVTATSELTGREAWRVADARRERSWWQAGGVGAGLSLQVDLGAGNASNADSLWLDRGHNLWGKHLNIDYADVVGVYTTHLTVLLPASGTVGGDPTTVNGCATEEGGWYSLFTAPVAPHRYWRIAVVESMQPIVTGIIFGNRCQLVSFSTVRDEDAMTRTQSTETSRALYQGTDKSYSARTLLISLVKIGAPDYDGMQRTLRRQLFEINQAVFVAMDWGTKPERGWLYRYDGTTYSAPLVRTLRSTEYRLREVGPLLR